MIYTSEIIFFHWISLAKRNLKPITTAIILLQFKWLFWPRYKIDLTCFLFSMWSFENTSVLFQRQTNWCKTKGQIFWQNHIISWLQKDNKEWSKLGPSILHSSGIIYRNSVPCLSYLSFSSAVSSPPQNIHVFHHVPSSSNEEYKVNSEEPCKTEAEVKGIWQPDRKSFWFFQQRNSSPNQCTC